MNSNPGEDGSYSSYIDGELEEYESLFRKGRLPSRRPTPANGMEEGCALFNNCKTAQRKRKCNRHRRSVNYLLIRAKAFSEILGDSAAIFQLCRVTAPCSTATTKNDWGTAVSVSFTLWIQERSSVFQQSLSGKCSWRLR